jgi:thymidylate kinase
MSDTGKLIVLEGPDRDLLDRQAGDLCRWLEGLGLAVHQTGEPTGGPFGVQVRLHDQGRLRFCPQSLALLLLADRLDHLDKEHGIRALLAAGCHVLCVHYRLAAYARLYDQVPLDWHRRINARCPAPDLTVYIGDRAAQGWGEPIAWVDAASEQDIARGCRRHLSTLLSLEEA